MKLQLIVKSVTQLEKLERVLFAAPNASDAKAAVALLPSGQLTKVIRDPALWGQHKPGQVFEFELVAAAPAEAPAEA